MRQDSQPGCYYQVDNNNHKRIASCRVRAVSPLRRMPDEKCPVVAVIADDPEPRRELHRVVESGGWTAWSGSRSDFHLHPARSDSGLVLFHLDPADRDGLQSLRRLREAGSLGLVAVAAGGSAPERARALENGADHCLPHPPEPEELWGTLKALWRRVRGGHPGDHGAAHFGARIQPDTQVPPDLAVSGWALDAAARIFRCPDGVEVILSDQELALLAALMGAPDRIVSKAALLGSLYPGEPDADPHRIEVILSRVRRKSIASGIVLPVRSVFGKGLVFLPRLR